MRAAARTVVRIVGVRTVTVLAVLAIAPSALAAQTPTDMDRLRRHDGVWVHVETGKPHTGPVIDSWDDGTLRERGTLVDGRWDGVHEWYYMNGQLATRESYVDGALHGLSESYFKNGTLSLREIWVNGERDGPYEAYWTRGWLAEKGRWRDGERCGEWESFGQTVIYPACS